MEKKRKNLFNAVFLAVIFVLTVWSVFKGEDISDVLLYISGANPIYLVMCIICVIFFVCGESVIIHYMMKNLGQNTKFSHCCLYSFAGFFFSCITPSASGGQPAQLLYMKKDKLPVSLSMLVLMVVTIMYKSVLIIIGLAVIIIQPAKIMVYLDPIMPWCILGIVLNVLCVGAMLLLVFRPGIVKFVLGKGLKLIKKIKPAIDEKAYEKKLESYMISYSEAAKYIKGHRKMAGEILVISFIQRIFLFFVTFLTYKAFGLKGIGAFTITVCQAMISVAVDMLPLPGGMGISEHLYLDVFVPIFGGTLTLPSMLVSRGISYYFLLILSAVLTFAAHFIISGRQYSRKTLEVKK